MLLQAESSDRQATNDQRALVKNKEYARRRKHLMEMAGPEAIVMVASSREQLRNNDVHYPFRQDSDFWYLTGFNEPEAVLVLLPEEGGVKSLLFCRERDTTREMWDGPMVGLEGAVEDYGMDQALPIEELDQHLPKLLAGCDALHYNMGREPALDQRVLGWLKQLREKKGVVPPDELVSVDHDLHEMRLLKSAAEIRAMRKSADVAVAAHRRAMQVCKPGMNEADIHAELMHTFFASHCQTAYLPIVGGGDNATVLHYIANNQPLQDGDLLLIDAGAEYQNYASDITRTFPVNGRFSEEQRALYEIVLAAQLAAIDKVRPGCAWQEVQDASIRTTVEGLVSLGLLKGEVDELISNDAHREFYVHNVGHWIGLDVHDVGDYNVDGQSRVLEPGMVMTVEPGIYISARREDVPERWRGIGIRIEDDVLVTKDGPEVLTDGVPKTIDEIEALMAG